MTDTEIFMGIVTATVIVVAFWGNFDLLQYMIRSSPARVKYFESWLHWLSLVADVYLVYMYVPL